MSFLNRPNSQQALPERITAWFFVFLTILSQQVQATPYYWVTNQNSGSLGTSAYFSTNPSTTGTLVFPSSPQNDMIFGSGVAGAMPSITGGAPVIMNTLQVTTTYPIATAITTYSNNVSIYSGIILGDGATFSLNTPLVLMDDVTFDVGVGGSLTLVSTSPISGLGYGLNKTGAGKATLKGSNTYTGGTTVSAGSLLLSGGSNLLSTSGAITTLGGTLDFGGLSQTTSGAITIQGGRIQNGTLTTTGSNFELREGIVGAILAGSYGINKTTTGTVVLSGSNKFTGQTTISDGSLVISGGDNRLSASGDITASGGILDLGGFSQTTSGAVTLAGGRIQNGTLTKSGSDFEVRSGEVSANLAALAPLGIGLLARLSFEGDLNDGSSVGTHDGTWVGTASFSSSAPAGVGAGTSSAYFDGTNRVNLTNGTDLNVNTGVAYTMSAWIKTAFTDTTQRVILAKASGGGGSTPAFFVDSSGKLRIDTYGVNAVSSSASVRTGNWVHVGLSYDGSTFRLYVNGVLDGSKTFNGGNESGGSWTFSIGQSSSSFPGGKFIGNIDEVCFWKRTLTAAEMAEVCAYGADGNPVNWPALNKTTADSVILSGTNTYTGETSVAGGTLQLGNGGASGSLSPLSALSVSGGAVLAFNQSDTVSQGTDFADGISGAGSVMQLGTGKLVLSGSNTFGGGVNLLAGTLGVHSGSALGAGPLTIGNGAALNNTSGSAVTLSTNNTQNWNGDFSFSGGSNLNLGTGSVTLGSDSTVTVSAGTLTVGGVIGGVYALEKSGAGALSLSAASTFSGGTTVTAGSLLLSGGDNRLSTSGDLTSSGGILDFGGFSQTTSGAIKLMGGQIRNGTLITTGGNFDVQSGTVSATLGGSGGLTKTTTGTVALSAVNTFAGATTISDGALVISGGSNRLSVSGDLSVSGGLLDLGGFSQTTSGTITLMGGRIQNGTLTATGGVFDVRSGTASASLGGALGLNKSTADTVTLSGTNTYTGATLVMGGTLQLGDGGAAGSLSVSSALTISSGAVLAFNQSDTITQGTDFATGISGAGGVVHLGSGKLTLAGSNTFSGGVRLFAGTLAVQSASALGTGSLTVGNGTTLDNTSGSSMTLSNNNAQIWNGDFTFKGSNHLNLGTGGVTLGADSTVTIGSGTLIAGAAISGGYGLGKAGSGVLTLSGANTFSGGMTHSDGTLNLNHSSALGAVASVFTIAGGTIDNSSGAALTLSNNNAQTWNGNFAFKGTNDLDLGAGTVTLGTNVILTVSAGTLTAGGRIGGAYSLTKAGGGILELSGANTYSGVTSVNSGTLTLNGTGSIAGGSVGVGTGAVLNVNGSAALDGTTALTAGGTVNFSTTSQTIGSLNGSGLVNLTNTALTIGEGAFSGVIAGGGSLVKTGGGTLSLSSANSLSGGITVGTGFLRLGNDSALGSGTLSVSGGVLSSTTTAARTFGNGLILMGTIGLGDATNSGTLVFNGNATLAGDVSANVMSATALNGIISGGNGFMKSGSGTLTLGGVNTFSGSTAVSGGTLVAVSGGLGATSSITVNGARLTAVDYNSAAPLSVDGSGYATLSGLNLSLGNVANGNVTSAAVNFSGASGTIMIGSLSGSGSTRFGSNATLTGGVNGGSVTVVGVLSGEIQGGSVNAGVLNSGAVNGGVTVLAGAGTIGVMSAGTMTLGGQASVGTLSGGVLNVNGSGTSTLTTLSGGSLNLGNGVVVSVSGGTDAGSIGGAGALTKTGSQTLSLSGANNYAGATLVNQGVVNIQNGSALGTNAGSTTVANGAGLELQGSITVSGESLVLNGTGVSSGGALRSISGTNIWGGSVTLGSASRIHADNGLLTLSSNLSGTNVGVTFGGAGDMTVSGSIGLGSGPLTKEGGGVLTLSGFNASTGATSVNAGVLTLNSTGALSGTVLGVSSGAALNVDGNATLASTTMLTANGTTSFTTVAQTIASLNGSGVLNLNNTALTVGSGTFSGLIAGGGSLLKSTTGVLTLSGGNSFTGGVHLVSGTLSVGVFGNGGELTSNLGASSSHPSNLVFAGGTLRYTGVGETSDRNMSILNGGTARLDVAAGVALTLSGSLAQTSGGVTKYGGGTLVLSGHNQYSGVTSIVSGTLRAGIVADAFGSNSAVTLSNTAGVTLDLAGYSNVIGSLAGGGSQGGNVQLGSGTLTVGDDGTSATYAGTIYGGGNLVKEGQGQWILTGSSHSGGSTEIRSGMLALDRVGGVFSDSAAVWINGGSLLVNQADTVRTVTLSSGMLSGATLSASTYVLHGGTVNGVLGEGVLTVDANVSLNGSSGANVINLAAGSLVMGSTAALTNGTLALTVGTMGSSGVVLDFTANASGYTLGSQQRLSGIGTIRMGAGKTLLNNGSLSPGIASVGTLTVSGNYTFGSSSVYEVDLTSTDADKLVVSGSVALLNGARVHISGVPALGRYVLGFANSGFTSGSLIVSGVPDAYGVVRSNTELLLMRLATIGTMSAVPASQSIITGGSVLFTVSVENSAPLSGSSLSFSIASGSGATGVISGPVPVSPQNASAALSGLKFVSSTVGPGVKGYFTVNDSGATNGGTMGSVSVNVFDHSLPIQAGTLDLGYIHVGGTLLSQGTLVANAAGYRAGLFITSLSPGLLDSGTGLIAAGSSRLISTGSVNATTAGVYSRTYTVNSSDDPSMSGGRENSALSLTVKAIIYTGKGIWNQTGSGTYAYGTFGNWTSDGGIPGVGGSLSVCDTVTFAKAGTYEITLNGLNPSVSALTLSTGSYTVNAGTAGSGTFTLAKATGIGVTVGGKQTFNVPVSLQNSTTFNVVGGADILRLNNTLLVAGTSRITKVGAGQLLLAGSNTFQGNTAVTAGTLAIGNGSGSATGYGMVTVESGATLSGSGTIAGSVAVSSGGLLSPNVCSGTARITAGSMTLNGDLRLRVGASGLNDALRVNGTMVIGASSNLLLANNSDANGQGSWGVGSYQLLTSTGLLSGKFANIVEGTEDVVPYFDNLFTYSTSGLTLTLRALVMPTIQVQPVGATVDPGASVTFRVEAEGGALRYYWQKNGRNITKPDGSLVTTRTYTIPSCVVDDTGDYTVVVWNKMSNGTVNVVPSKVAKLIVRPPNTAPKFLTLKVKSIAVPIEKSGTLSACAQSSLPWTYQWKKDGVALGAPVGVAKLNAPVEIQYPIKVATDASEGSYTLVLENSAGRVESFPGVVSVVYPRPRLLGVSTLTTGGYYQLAQLVSGGMASPSYYAASIVGPWFASMKANEIIRVSVRGAVSYRWEYSAINKKLATVTLSNGVTPDLDFQQVPRNPGTYRLIATNSDGVTSQVTFFIRSFIAEGVPASRSLTFVAQPIYAAGREGSPQFLDVFMSGTVLSYQWYKLDAHGVGQMVPGATGNVLYFASLQPAEVGMYYVVVKDRAGGTYTSQRAQVELLTP